VSPSPDRPHDPPTSTGAHEVRFAHDSERQFALLLDFYGVRWQYEPHTFVLARAANGTPTSAFRPDFYLPDYDLHIEITTLRQKLVTKKNRKAREVMEHYPDVRVKVLYQRDFVHLLVKYGLESPSQLPHYAETIPAGEAGQSLLELVIEPQPVTSHPSLRGYAAAP
jgi:hypoxanthine phosphoribosyltransferase